LFEVNVSDKQCLTVLWLKQYRNRNDLIYVTFCSSVIFALSAVIDAALKKF